MTQGSKSVREIIHSYTEDRMSARPEYYSGRGATTTDLDSWKLGRIYDGICAEINPEAAAQFVQMVAAIPKLSATDFLVALYSLEANGWNWNPELLPRTHGNYAADEGSAFATVFDTLAGRSAVDETWLIRGDFLSAHRSEYTPSEKENEPKSVYWAGPYNYPATRSNLRRVK